MKRGDLLRHLRVYGCVLRREGGSHSIWYNPQTGAQEAVPRHVEVSNLLARSICRGLSIPEIGKARQEMFLHLLSLGRVSYADGLAIQERVVAARKAGAIGDTLLLLEHPAVLTLGRNARRDNILASDELLARKGVEIHEINRGGDVTYHGPGQLIGYPIVDLRGDLPGKKGPHLGPVDFVRLLEEALIRTCGEFRVMAQRVKGCTGVWTVPNEAVASRKIAAIGVHVSAGVTSHGFALNVTTDLRDFEWIVPCGIKDKGVTSLELESPLEPAPAMSDAINATARCFGRIFNRQMLWTESLDQLLESPRANVL